MIALGLKRRENEMPIPRMKGPLQQDHPVAQSSVKMTCLNFGQSREKLAYKTGELPA
jgi:hypothetical protein